MLVLGGVVVYQIGPQLLALLGSAVNGLYTGASNLGKSAPDNASQQAVAATIIPPDKPSFLAGIFSPSKR
jgi:hypothetical protein